MTTDLRQLAEAAGQSGATPWYSDGLLADQEFIAACTPDRILALLDVVDKARETLDCFDSYSCLNEIGQARMEDEAGELRDALRTALAALDARGK